MKIHIGANHKRMGLNRENSFMFLQYPKLNKWFVAWYLNMYYNEFLQGLI